MPYSLKEFKVSILSYSFLSSIRASFSKTSSSYSSLREKRYSSFDAGNGKDFEGGKLELSDLYKIAQENGELTLQSGKQELFENIINQYI